MRHPFSPLATRHSPLATRHSSHLRRSRCDRQRDQDPEAYRTVANLAGWLFSLGLIGISSGCGQPAASRSVHRGRVEATRDATVVVYSALDQEFAEPVLKEQAEKAGIALRTKFDVESTKTVGLANTLIAEAVQPRCDLFWNNEILNTIRLKDHGAAAAVPAVARRRRPGCLQGPRRDVVRIRGPRPDPAGQHPARAGGRPAHRAWPISPIRGGRARSASPSRSSARPPRRPPASSRPGARRRPGKFFLDLKANGVQVFSGNKQVAMAVGSGQVEVGLTDTDDAMGEIEAGSPVAIVYPDRQPGQLGTLFIPNTLAMIKGAPHAEAAGRLADRIYSPEVEAALAEGPSAQIPLLKSTAKPARVETPATVHPMAVDFQEAARQWDRAAAFLTREFAD